MYTELAVEGKSCRVILAHDVEPEKERPIPHAVHFDSQAVHKSLASFVTGAKSGTRNGKPRLSALLKGL